MKSFLCLGERVADIVVLRPLTISDADVAAVVVRAAFAAQSRATNPASSALHETTDSIAAKIAAGSGFGAFQRGSVVALLLWQIDDDALHVGRVSTPTTALRAVPLPRFAGEERGRRFPPPLAGEGDHAKRGGGGRRLIAACEAAHERVDAPTAAVVEKRLS